MTAAGRAQARAGAPEGDASVIWVCHANVIRYALVSLGGLSREAGEDLELDYCSVRGVALAPDGAVRVLFYGRLPEPGPDGRGA